MQLLERGWHRCGPPPLGPRPTLPDSRQLKNVYGGAWTHVTAGRGLTPEAQLCPQGLPFQPCLPLAPRRGSLPAAFAPPSASGGSGPAWPLSGSAGTTLLPATSAAPTPPPGRAETERRKGKGDGAGRRGREKRQVWGGAGGVKKKKKGRTK